MWAAIDRLEGQRAVLELEDGHIVELYKKHLLVRAVAGSVIRITMSLDREQEDLRGKGATGVDSS
jgi:hypothetical protein